MVVFVVGLHLNEIVCDIADDLSTKFGQITISGEVAGVLICDPFFEFLLRIDLDASFPQILGEKFDRMDDGNRWFTIGITQPVWTFVPKVSIGVASFGYRDLFGLEPYGRIVREFGHVGHALGVTCKHGQVGVIPAL